MRRVAQALALITAVAFVVTGCTSSHHAKTSPSVRTVPGSATALPSVQYRPPEGPALDHPVAIDGVMSTFFLDRGALHVNQPPESIHPVESMARATAAAEEADPGAFSDPASLKPIIVGFGLVTIDRRLWPRPAYDNTPAWVVAYQDNRPSSCGAMHGPQSPIPSPTPPLPGHHYTIFVLPDAETWAVTFVERGLGNCGGPVMPSAATLAQSNLYVPWRVVARSGRDATLAFSASSCATVTGYGGSSNDRNNTESLGLSVARPFGHPPGCAGTTTRTQVVHLFRTTTRLLPPRTGPGIP